LVAILDADQEGFLRSDRSLIQTVGRAARHLEGRAILYADRVTGSMQRALDEMSRRREVQLAYNEQHGITPRSIVKSVDQVRFAYPAQSRIDRRAAGHVEGRASLSAGGVPGKMPRPVEDGSRRREVQIARDAQHGLPARSMVTAVDLVLFASATRVANRTWS